MAERWTAGRARGPVHEPVTVGERAQPGARIAASPARQTAAAPSVPAEMTAGRAIVEVLKAEGVKAVYGIPGRPRAADL